MSDHLTRLAQAHQALQVRLQTSAARRVGSSYRTMLTKGTNQQQWLDEVLPEIVKARTQSADAAKNYMRELRDAQIPAAPDMPDVPVRGLDAPALRTSLTVTGRVTYQRALGNAPTAAEFEVANRTASYEISQQAAARREEAARKISSDRVAGAVMRHVANGGRYQVMDTVAADRSAFGYVRRTHGNSCAFCLMLASRGPVFKKDSFDSSDIRFVGQGEVKVHDSCACTFDPVYTRKSSILDQSDGLSDLWATATKGYSGNDALNALRRAVAKTG